MTHKISYKNNNLLGHFRSKIRCLVSVVPSNILSKYWGKKNLAYFVSLKKYEMKSVNLWVPIFLILDCDILITKNFFVYLIFSCMIQTCHKNVAHHENRKSDDCSTHTESCDWIKEISVWFFIHTRYIWQNILAILFLRQIPRKINDLVISKSFMCIWQYIYNWLKTFFLLTHTYIVPFVEQHWGKYLASQIWVGSKSFVTNVLANVPNRTIIKGNEIPPRIAPAIPMKIKSISDQLAKRN